MANIKISDLPAADNTTGADVFPIVQSDTTKKAALSLLPVSAATQTALNTKADAVATTNALLLKADVSALNSHVGNTSNPHSVTKTQVGLGNVDNTSDADKPISNAVTTALTSKVSTSQLAIANGVATLDSVGKLVSSQIPDIAVSDYLGAAANEAAMLALTGQKGDWCSRTDLGTNWIITGSTPTQISSWTQLSYPASPVVSVNGEVGAVVLDKSDIGLGNVDNTSDANKPISTATQTALDAKENTITAGTTSQYFRGDKTFQTLEKSAVGLGNVDNTSDANKPISTATQTALNGKHPVQVVSTLNVIGNSYLTAGRNQFFYLSAAGQGSYTITLPYTNNQNGDTITLTPIFTGPFPSGTITIRAAGQMAGGNPLDYVTVYVLLANGEAVTLISDGSNGYGGWRVVSVGGSLPRASNSLPNNLGTPAAGTSSNFSRADHVHSPPTPWQIGAMPDAPNLITLTDPNTEAIQGTLGTDFYGQGENTAHFTHPDSVAPNVNIGADFTALNGNFVLLKGTVLTAAGQALLGAANVQAQRDYLSIFVAGSNLPAQGNSQRLYLLTDTGRVYAWINNAYVEVAGTNNNPVFTAFTAAQISTAGEISFGNLSVNRGNAFATNGRFTAPRTGVYHFAFNAMAQAPYAPALTTIQFRKNGAILSPALFTTTSQYQVDLAPGYPAFASLSLSAAISLNVNEYVSVYLDTGSISANACFTGHLLG